MIAEAGPIPVSQYMALCLFDPKEGYYTTREPFGAKGDFTTAPEVSQMFGELVAVWLASAWQAAGAPKNAILAEIGPGRGTLMRDMLRTLARIAPDLMRRVAMIETSPRLVDVQKQLLGNESISWHRAIADLPDAPLFIVGNELFDAIPIRQFVKTQQGWRERCVGLDADGELVFIAGPGTTDAPLPDAPVGAIYEAAPARNALMLEIAERIARQGGAGLFIDYGHLENGVGDTLQAMRAHAHADVLATPGEADLTSHVDFAALGAAAGAAGLDARTTTQARFLIGLGLLERAGQLGAGANADLQERLHGEVERLAAPEQMGELFKVLMVGRTITGLPPA
nr:class I SAM-dependent methyltransferase [Aliihoeflea sp. 40Bstr573]